MYLKRDDLIHPFVSGNKWRKLKYNVEEAKRSGKIGILTYGGAYSNHLIATACACAAQGLKSIGIVRGEELNPTSNLVLRMCYEYGMDLRFVPRSQYREAKKGLDQAVGFFTVPEGGDNELGVEGCEEILSKDESYDHIIVAVGTGTTFTGLINASHHSCQVHGIAAMKQADYLKDYIRSRVQSQNWKLHTDYAFNGFGKYTDELLGFMRLFTTQTGILLDPVYTGKMMWATYDLIRKGLVKEGESVLCVHTGGLTGILTDDWRQSLVG